MLQQSPASFSFIHFTFFIRCYRKNVPSRPKSEMQAPQAEPRLSEEPVCADVFTAGAEDFIPLYKSCLLPVCGRVKLCTRHSQKLVRLGKNRSPNHKLLFQLRLSQQPGKTAPRIIFPRCLLEVGRNAKLVVEHDAKDVCFLFSSAVSCTNCFVPR